MRLRLWQGLFAVAIAGVIAVAGKAQDSQLFSQSASATLERQFAREDLSWLLLDGVGRVLAQRWELPEKPISPGSLVKPFVALAYGEQHNFVYPTVHCAGTADRCWLPKGHGDIGLQMAIAHSCNAYFIALAKGMDVERARPVFVRYGLQGPGRDVNEAGMIGLGGGWSESPVALARAYLGLINDAGNPGIERIIAGMAVAARSGTARGVDAALGKQLALAKTGTAPCSHAKRAAGDGLAVVLYPEIAPRLLLLVRLHGGTGAQAAGIAGAMLRSVGEGGP